MSKTICIECGKGLEHGEFVHIGNVVGSERWIHPRCLAKKYERVETAIREAALNLENADVSDPYRAHDTVIKIATTLRETLGEK